MGWCLFAEQCRFRHPIGGASLSLEPSSTIPSELLQPAAALGGSGRSSASSLAADRRQAFSRLSNERRLNRGAGRRNKIINRNRAGSFRRWLMDTFGREVLGSGTGVLDIAGGKGELSFELANLTGVPSTVIDPRPLRLDRFIKRLMAGIYHRTGPWQAYNCLPVPSSTSEVRRPDHVGVFFNDRLLDLLERPEEEEKSAEGFQEMLTAARAVAWTEKGLVSHEEEQSLPDEEEAGDERKEDQGEEEEDEEVQNAEDLTDWASVRHRLLGCSVIVGLHPDQATGAIVDFALKWNKGFAIVPCCVYRKHFPRRQLDGEPVATYQQFVAYLVAKSPERIKTAILDFEGKNLVLYSLPPTNKP